MLCKPFVLLTFLLAVAAVHAAPPLAEKSLLGAWREKSGAAVYVFDRNNDFVFRQAAEGLPQGGAWQFAKEVCLIPQSGQKGNLMLHVGTDRCCFQAYMLGSNLILSSLPPRSYGVCSDRVLVKDSVGGGDGK